MQIGKPDDRRPGEQLLTNQETIIIITVLGSVFVVSAVIFGIICYKKNCCPGIAVYTSKDLQSNELLANEPISYTTPKSKSTPKKPKNNT